MRSTVAPWVKEITERVIGGAPFAVGDDVPHPSGRLVRIVGGQYWGQAGLSNHWTWREVLNTGLSYTLESGYGRRPERVDSK